MAGEQRLAIELIALSGAKTLRTLSDRRSLPHPRSYLGVLVVFATLSAIGKINASAQRFVDVFGLLVILAYLLGWAGSDPTGFQNAAALPARLVTGKGLPTKPTTSVAHRGWPMLEGLVALLAAAETGRVFTGGGGGGGGKGTEAETPGATEGELSIPDTLAGAAE